DGRDSEARRIFRNANGGLAGWSFLLGALSVTVTLLTIVWTYRSARNARALGRTGARLGPGWAIACWFIPLASWVLVYIIVSDLWRSSEPDIGRGTTWRQLPGPTVVRLWTGSRVGGSVLTLGAMTLAVSGVTGEPATRVLLVLAAAISLATSLLT